MNSVRVVCERFVGVSLTRSHGLHAGSESVTRLRACMSDSARPTRTVACPQYGVHEPIHSCARPKHSLISSSSPPLCQAHYCLRIPSKIVSNFTSNTRAWNPLLSNSFAITVPDVYHACTVGGGTPSLPMSSGNYRENRNTGKIPGHIPGNTATSRAIPGNSAVIGATTGRVTRRALGQFR